MTLFLFLTFLCTLITHSLENQLLLQARNAHRAVKLHDRDVRHLSKLSNVTHLEEVLNNLLVPRVVNTPSHTKVYQYITKELEDLGWNVEVDEFEAQTPNFGVLPFKNIVASLDPSAGRFLVLSCHYDSKFFKDFDFIGATDSAVPCAMLINLARVMKDDLNKIKGNSELSLKLVFFDGEEAFETWGPNDSIYGAKHLAAKWEQSVRAAPILGELTNDLNRVDILVLLDLIGASNPKFSCLVPETYRWYLRLAGAEDRLAQMDLLSNYKENDINQRYFMKQLSYSFIEDDHIPFLERGVPIIHVIPTPFPSVWHTINDNRDIIDIDTVENLNKIFRLFVAEYLHLSVQ